MGKDSSRVNRSSVVSTLETEHQLLKTLFTELCQYINSQFIIFNNNNNTLDYQQQIRKRTEFIFKVLEWLPKQQKLISVLREVFSNMWKVFYLVINNYLSIFNYSYLLYVIFFLIF